MSKLPPIAEEYGLSATYSPEDNKLRLYATEWFDDELKARVKGAGFKWARLQECWVAPKWTPKREDLLLDLCGEIGDEQYGAAERSADRVERFGDYRDKRRGEAAGHADTFDGGPSVFGNQNRRRAERAAERHDRHRTRAVSQWSKAEYWQQRTAGVISHALYKQSPSVRRGRILEIEKAQRLLERDIEILRSYWEGFQKILTLPGNDRPIGKDDPKGGDYRIIKSQGRGARCLVLPERCENPQVLVMTMANYGHLWGDYQHPRANLKGSLYTLLTYEADPITPEEAARLYLQGMHPEGPGYAGGYSARWIEHYANRLAYENTMLENEGGKAAEVDIIPGGFIGEHQIYKVNKSKTTGRVVSVLIKGQWGFTRINGRRAYVDHANGEGLAKLNIERLGEDAYRPPTPEELQAFQNEQKENKAKAQKANAGQPKLLNPTDEDAQRLQDHWNARAAELHAKHCTYGEYKPTEVRRMTQAEYSTASKGSYSSFETILICAHGHRARRKHGQDADASPVVFKIRKRYGGGGFTAQADAVVVLTDKPQKPLPLDWEAINAGKVEPCKADA